MGSLLQCCNHWLNRRQVVVLLQGKLADVGVNFKEVLEVRTKNLQASDHARKILSPRYQRIQCHLYIHSNLHHHCTIPPPSPELHSLAIKTQAKTYSSLILLHPRR